MDAEPMSDPSMRAKLSLFWRKLGYMTSAGVPLSEALQAVMAEVRDQELAPILEKLKAEIEKGRPLSQALESFPKVFTPMTWAIARAGEMTGQIGQAMTRLAEGVKSGTVTVEEPDCDLDLGLDDEIEVDEEEDPATEEAVAMTSEIIQEGIQSRARDIHVEPFEHRVVVRYRVDGVLREARVLPRDRYSVVVARIKIMAGMDLTERRRPQDGRIRMEVDGKEYDLRVNITPILFGEAVCMRILDKSAPQLDLAKLGMAQEAIDTLARWSAEPSGIIILAGPTGSGKTTVLYSVLEHIKRPELKIITIEDPVEYALDGVCQCPVTSATGATIPLLVRSALRSDPDVIAVCEMRDRETAEMCVQASLAGHLIMTTLPTRNAPGALRRLVDMGLDPFLVNNTIIGVMAQRLCRKLCDACKEPYAATESELRMMGVDAGEEVTLHRAKGCHACGQQGYRGRIPIVEQMDMTDDLRKALDGCASAEELCRIAREGGMRTLRECGIAQARAGVTSLQEVNRVLAGSEP